MIEAKELEKLYAELDKLPGKHQLQGYQEFAATPEHYEAIKALKDRKASWVNINTVFRERYMDISRTTMVEYFKRYHEDHINGKRGNSKN